MAGNLAEACYQPHGRPMRRLALAASLIAFAAGTAGAATMTEVEKTRYRESCTATAGQTFPLTIVSGFCNCSLEKIQAELAPLPVDASGTEPLPDETLGRIMRQCAEAAASQ
jgi:hypothetical protein